MRRTRYLAVLVLSASVLTACGASDDPGQPGSDGAFDGSGDAVDGPTAPGTDDDATDASDATDGSDGTDGSDATDGVAGTGQVSLEDATQAAVDDLAATAQVLPADVEVVSAERVTWPDGALGCPQPGEMYTQALVPGYRIVVAAGGDEVTYTGGEAAPPVRCDEPVAPAEGGT